MGYKKEILQNSPGFFDEDDRKILIDNDILFFGFKIESTPSEDCDIDLRAVHDSSIGIEGERPRFECGYDWWDVNNLHYSMRSGFSFKTINIAERKHHYWEEYEKKYNNRYNPSYNKNYFVRMTMDRSCIIIISPDVILDLLKRHETSFLPTVTSYGRLENFWCFKEEDVKTFLRQKDGTYKLKPYVKEDTNESIRKSDLARRARELHTRKNQESQSILSGEV
jgi:hypothetical protein